MKELPKHGRYFFAKTEVCDVAPYPSPETFALLQQLYADHGPVYRAYKTFGITYCDTQFLKIISGNLYVDKEKELHSIFPSHSYFFGSDYTVRPVTLRGFFTSLKNAHCLKKVRGDVSEVYGEMKKRLARKFVQASYEVCVEDFLQEYEFIFCVNIFTERALRDLAKFLPREMSLAVALQYFPKDMRTLLTPPTDIIGNTFEFSDTSSFVVLFQEGWKGVVPKGISEKRIRIAQEFIRLREYGRWLALRHISRMRRQMRTPVASALYEDLPSILTDSSLSQRRGLGVSAGKVTGRIVSSPTERGILMTSQLSPELAAHFEYIEGVVADHGGLLSHFVILARERGIPVVVNYPIHELRVGERVTLDGSTGEVIPS